MRIGLDIGGTKTEGVVLTESGEILEQCRVATGYGPEAVVDTAVDVITRLAAGSGTAIAELSSIGVGIPGSVDSARGVVSHALNLGLHQLPLGQTLAERLGAPVRVENDVNAAALGAFHLLDQAADASMAYLNLGTGLAAGLVLRGELWRGARGTAGEIGHILVDPLGPPDADDQNGALEVMASGSGVARQWSLNGDSSVTGLFDAADAGNPEAIVIRDRLFDGVAASVRILVLTVDIELVVIGGGVSRLGDRLLDGVHSVFDGWSQQSPFIESLELASRLRFLPDGAPVAALGAAYLGGS